MIIKASVDARPSDDLIMLADTMLSCCLYSNNAQFSNPFSVRL